MSSFAERIAKRPDHIYLVKGKDATSRQAWYYVLINRGKKQAFEKREGTPNLNLLEYGKILFSGYGAEPPEAIKKRMEDEYGFKE